MFPHERSLVEKMKDKPFALLGINTDRNLADAKKKNQQEKISWRSWYDGSTGGPICKQYGVTGFPTIYVLDHKGVIRYKGVRNEAMDQAVETLLAELEKEQPKAE